MLAKVILMAAVGLAGGASHGAVNWDEALVVGRTNGDKCFYRPGEEMVFTLELKGVKGDALVNIQDAKGCIRTQMLKRPDADNIWINCLCATIDALDLLAAED